MDNENLASVKKNRKQQTLPVPDEIHPNKLYRLNQFLPHHIPISKSSWYEGIKAGKYPAPERLGPRTSVYRGSAILPIIKGEV